MFIFFDAHVVSASFFFSTAQVTYNSQKREQRAFKQPGGGGVVEDAALLTGNQLQQRLNDIYAMSDDEDDTGKKTGKPARKSQDEGGEDWEHDEEWDDDEDDVAIPEDEEAPKDPTKTHADSQAQMTTEHKAKVSQMEASMKSAGEDSDKQLADMVQQRKKEETKSASLQQELVKAQQR